MGTGGGAAGGQAWLSGSSCVLWHVGGAWDQAVWNQLANS